MRNFHGLKFSRVETSLQKPQNFYPVKLCSYTVHNNHTQFQDFLCGGGGGNSRATPSVYETLFPVMLFPVMCPPTTSLVVQTRGSLMPSPHLPPSRKQSVTRRWGLLAHAVRWLVFSVWQGRSSSNVACLCVQLFYKECCYGTSNLSQKLISE